MVSPPDEARAEMQAVSDWARGTRLSGMTILLDEPTNPAVARQCLPTVPPVVSQYQWDGKGVLMETLRVTTEHMRVGWLFGWLVVWLVGWLGIRMTI